MISGIWNRAEDGISTTRIVFLERHEGALERLRRASGPLGEARCWRREHDKSRVIEWAAIMTTALFGAEPAGARKWWMHRPPV